MSNKVSREVAVKDITEWLDVKKIKDAKRDSNKDSVDALIDAIECGVLVKNDDNTLVQELDFPTEGDEPVTHLTFKPRLRVREVRAKTKNVKPSDIDGRLVAIISALTDQPSGVINALETNDYSVAQSIAVFFL